MNERRTELEKFSDKVGEAVAHTDRGAVPVSEKHIARFHELRDRHEAEKRTRREARRVASA